jgi:hypothetical protein
MGMKLSGKKTLRLSWLPLNRWYYKVGERKAECLFKKLSKGEEAMNTPPDNYSNSKPAVAIGHVELLVTNVKQGVDFFMKLGIRHIHQDPDFAVLELRGGTHLVLEEPEPGVTIPEGHTPPFDLMVDDLQAAHRKCEIVGMKPSEIQTGRIHDNFYLDGPNGYKIRITSSHTSGRPV